MRSPGLRWALVSFAIVAAGSGCGVRNLACAPTPKINAPESLRMDRRSLERKFFVDLRKEKGILCSSGDGWLSVPFLVPSDGDPEGCKEIESRSEARLMQWEAHSLRLSSADRIKFSREEPVEEPAPEDPAKLRLAREHVDLVQKKYSLQLLDAELTVARLKALLAVNDDEKDRVVQSARLDEAKDSLRVLEEARDKEVPYTPVVEEKPSSPQVVRTEDQLSIKPPSRTNRRRTALRRDGEIAKPRPNRVFRPVRVVDTTQFGDGVSDMCASIDKATGELGRSMRKGK